MMDLQLFFDNFDVIAAAPNGVKKLRELILQLAVRGNLVPQDPADEPAGKLLERIRKDRQILIKNKEIKSLEILPVAPDDSPFAIPSQWSWVRLGEISQKLGAGSTPKGGKSVYSNMGIKFLRSQNVWNDGLRLTEVAYIPPEIHQKMEGTIVTPGDILLNITGASIGRSSIVPDNFDEANVSQHVAIVRMVDTVLRHYIHLYFISPVVQDLIMDAQVGISREGLSMTRLKDFLVPIPPQGEVKRIVAKVDELMKLCDTLETQQQQNRSHLTQMQKSAIGQLLSAPDADAFGQHWQDIVENFELLFDDVGAIGDLRQAILQLAVQGKLVRQNLADEPVALSLKADSKSPYTSKRSKIEQVLDDCEVEIPSTWQWIRLESICGTIQTGPFGSLLHASDYITGGIPLVNPQNMQDGCIRPSTDKTISEATKKRLIGYVLQRDDIVLARRGEVGRCAVIGEKEAGWLCGTGSLFIRLLPEILPTYIKLFFDAPETRKDLQDASVGSTMNNLNQKILGSMPIGLPPLAEQKRIVAKVNQLMTLCDTLQAHLTHRQQSAIDLAEVAVRQVLDRE
jgi:type I restriction enzyme, S subunit